MLLQAAAARRRLPNHQLPPSQLAALTCFDCAAADFHCDPSQKPTDCGVADEAVADWWAVVPLYESVHSPPQHRHLLRVEVKAAVASSSASYCSARGTRPVQEIQSDFEMMMKKAAAGAEAAVEPDDHHHLLLLKPKRWSTHCDCAKRRRRWTRSPGRCSCPPPVHAAADHHFLLTGNDFHHWEWAAKAAREWTA